MIYWFTGQPGAGKTTLADMLKEELEKGRNFVYKVLRIDGDDMRELFSNKDYTIKGRVENISTAQRIAHYLHNQDKDVIVSLVSPYIDQREDFKKLLGDNLKEIYVHTSDKRERDNFKSIAYTPPQSNFIDIDTTIDNPEESLKKILDNI
jgi:adenylylsulfate kinase|tara:strand:+ start:180 stop:629 length:450 start_codon:yes stop_codon:yes gene_type:complete